MRKRDYKAEYQRRTERAKAQGYSSYGAKRYQTQTKPKIIRERLQAEREVLAERWTKHIYEHGIFGSPFWEDDTEFWDTADLWDLFRDMYNTDGG